MKNNLKILSISTFVMAIPSLIVTDWYYEGFGILVMFILITIGVVLDQIIRLKFPNVSIRPISNYRKNKLLNIFALILFIQSPMALIFANKLYSNMGFWLFLIMISIGIIANQIARIKYPYYKSHNRL